MRIFTGTALFFAALSAMPAHAQSQRPWALTLEGAVSDLHGKTAVDGPGGALRLSRRLMNRDWMRGEVALTGGSADENRGFGTVEAGVSPRRANARRRWARLMAAIAETYRVSRGRGR